MYVYNYHPQTLEYLSTSDADLDEMESNIQGHPVYFLPANATFDEPPVEQEGFIRRFVDGAWGYSPVQAPEEPPTEEPEPYKPNLEEYEELIQSHIDSTARSRSFRDGVTMASYYHSTVIEWAQEAQAFIAWRDQIWIYVYEQHARVLAGEREQPTMDELLAELPEPNWLA
jgi:hypothetical protein